MCSLSVVAVVGLPPRLPVTSVLWHSEDTYRRLCPGSIRLLRRIVRSQVLRGTWCIWWQRQGWRIDEKRWREAVRWAPYPLRSCLLAFPSSSSFLLPKGRGRSKEADMKGWDCASRCPASLLSPLQIWKCWIPNPACTYDAYSLPQPHLSYFLDSLPSLLPPCLNPSSSSSIPSSSAALGLLGAEALDWQLLWQSVERAESGWVSALLQGLKAAANVVASCRSERSPWNKTQSPLLFSLLLSTEAGRSQIAFSNRSRVYSGCGNWNTSQTHILPGCFSLPFLKFSFYYRAFWRL